MRCRRLCEKKVSGKCHVPNEIREDYVNGGESREIVELALLDALAKYGVLRQAYKKVKKEFITRVQVLKERLSEKSKETWGRWMTEERMRKDKDLNLSAKSIKDIKAFCDKFPETHKRSGCIPWQNWLS
ncbi:unnamed protein product [Durusdinium trenchii]|uniref:Uncharacterized protein n=2 Tax=Durusdinium trenchii TaxID=1381693 RepID=A0ABP0RNL5_9DINO